MANRSERHWPSVAIGARKLDRRDVGGRAAVVADGDRPAAATAHAQRVQVGQAGCSEADAGGRLSHGGFPFAEMVPERIRRTRQEPLTPSPVSGRGNFFRRGEPQSEGVFADEAGDDGFGAVGLLGGTGRAVQREQEAVMPPARVTSASGSSPSSSMRRWVRSASGSLGVGVGEGVYPQRGGVGDQVGLAAEAGDRPVGQAHPAVQRAEPTRDTSVASGSSQGRTNASALGTAAVEVGGHDVFP